MLKIAFKEKLLLDKFKLAIQCKQSTAVLEYYKNYILTQASDDIIYNYLTQLLLIHKYCYNLQNIYSSALLNYLLDSNDSNYKHSLLNLIQNKSNDYIYYFNIIFYLYNYSLLPKLAIDSQLNITFKNNQFYSILLSKLNLIKCTDSEKLNVTHGIICSAQYFQYLQEQLTNVTNDNYDTGIIKQFLVYITLKRVNEATRNILKSIANVFKGLATAEDCEEKLTLLVPLFVEKLIEFESKYLSSLLFYFNQLLSTSNVNYSIVFMFIGSTSKSVLGTKLLLRLNTFTELYKLVGNRQKENVLLILLEYLDYSVCLQNRILLSMILTGTYLQLRLYATKLLESIPSTEQWLIQLLLVQFYDVSDSVKLLSLQILECKYLADFNVLALISTYDLSHLYALAPNYSLCTLLQVNSTPALIENYTTDWINSANRKFTTQLELKIHKLTIPATEDSKDSSNLVKSEEITFIAFDAVELFHEFHFIAELCKHATYFVYVKDKVFPLLLKKLQTFSCLDEENRIPFKSILWDIAYIGKTENGKQLVKSLGIIEIVYSIFHAPSTVNSIKATCYYVLCLLTNDALSIKLPTPIATPTPHSLCPRKFYYPPAFTFTQKLILHYITLLGSQLTQHAAVKKLNALKLDAQKEFNSFLMFYIFDYINTFRYSLNARKFIVGLFEGVGDEGLVDWEKWSERVESGIEGLDKVGFVELVEEDKVICVPRVSVKGFPVD